MRVAETLFVAIGLALLGTSGACYYYDVQRPLAWPRTEATVVSSRVINPRNPDQHSPEVVLRFEEAGAIRQLTVRANWSSNSYSIVKRYVDGYPPGAAVEVAINPADANDVRYELGPTWTNLIGPGIVGALGLLCFVAGLWVLLKPSVSRPVPAGAAGRVTRRVGWLFAFIGVGTLVLGAWLTWRGGTTAATWVAVDAESVAARPISTMGGRRQGGPRYDVQVTFRYVAGGRPFESDTTSGMASASPQLRDERMAQFAPGSRHRIYHRPDDPNIIRYQPESFFGLFALPAGMGLMGLLFLAFGAAMLRVRPDPGPAGPPDIDAEDRLIAQQQRFRR